MGFAGHFREIRHKSDDCKVTEGFYRVIQKQTRIMIPGLIAVQQHSTAVMQTGLVEKKEGIKRVCRKGPWE